MSPKVTVRNTFSKAPRISLAWRSNSQPVIPYKNSRIRVTHLCRSPPEL